MKRWMKRPVISYAVITIGVAICAVGLNLFLVPGKIVSGGFSGIATIFYYLWKIPIGVTMLALNIPFFLLAFKRLGRSFAWKTLWGLILFSLFADIFPVWQMTDEPALAAVYGGVLMGFGLGIVFLFGGSTGGTDLIARLISDTIPGISVGTCLFFIDFLIIFASGLLFEVQAALYAIISVFLSTKLIEMLTEGLNKGKAYLIISKKYDEIETVILQDMNRGVTELKGRGVYSGNDATLLLCMLERASEVVKLRKRILEIDEKAFLVSWDAREVRGEGFSWPKHLEK